MFYNNLSISQKYETPCVEVLDAISASVLCTSSDGVTSDFEVEDFAF